MRRKSTVNFSKIILYIFVLISLVSDFSYSLDSSYSNKIIIKKIIGIKTVDNLNGTYSRLADDEIERKIKQINRYKFIKFPEKLSNKQVKDKEIVKTIIKNNQTDALLYCTIDKELDRINLSMKLLIDTGEVFVKSDASIIYNEATEKNIRETVSGLIGEMFEKMGFITTITGIEGNNLTIDGGKNIGIKVGDILESAEIDKVIKHPLLNEIIEIKWNRTGKIEIDSVDDDISFGKIITKKGNILVGNKIIGVSREESLETEHIERVNKTEKKHKSKDNDKFSDENIEIENPSYGWISARGGFGMPGYVYTDSTGTVSAADSSFTGYSFGAGIKGELWITKNIISRVKYDTSFTSLGNDKESLSGVTFTNYGLGVGYRFYPLGDVGVGPHLDGIVGYRSSKAVMPILAAYDSQPRSITGIYVGVIGGIPIIKNLNAEIEIDMNLTKTYLENNQAVATVESVSATSFNLSIERKLNESTGVGFLFDADINSILYLSKKNISFRNMEFSPYLKFYF